MDYNGLAILGVVLASLSGIYYVWTILNGSTKPQRVTWFGWSLATILGAWSALAAGAGGGAWVAATYAVVLSIVFLISLFPKYGKPGGQKMDYVIAGVATAGIVFWQVANLSDSIAVIIAIVSDFWFSWLTIRESWRQPDTEALGPWVVGSFACALGVAALESFSFAAMAFPVYILLIDVTIASVLASRKKVRLFG
jgi:hypothetical protein